MSLTEKLTSIKENLTSVLGDINTALVNKGAREVINLADIPMEIESIEHVYDGEPGKPYIDTSLITNWREFFINGRRLELLPLIDTSSGENFHAMFSGCSSLTTIPYLNTSNGTDFSYMFVNDTALTSVPQLNTSNGTNFARMFYGCTSLTSLPQLDTSKATNLDYYIYNCDSLVSTPRIDTSQATSFSGAFMNCEALESLEITTTKIMLTAIQNCPNLKNLIIGEGFNQSIVYLDTCPNLTQESLHGMIENLADMTGLDTKTFNVGSTNLAKIDEEHISMLEAKNWSYS